MSDPFALEEEAVKQKREPQPVIEGAERDDLRLEVVRLYRQGLTLRQTAERSGYSYSLVRRLLLEAGEPMRDRRYRSEPQATGDRP